MNEEKGGMYIAVIGDIVDSRLLPDRGQVQRKLMEVLTSVNDAFAEDLASVFMITLGDEFQGLLKTGKHLMTMIDRIAFSLFPVGFRFGFGVGGVTTDIDYQNALGADGPAYYRARQMMQSIKESKGKKRMLRTDMMILSREDEDSDEEGYYPDDLLNALFSVCTILKSQWTQPQRDAIRAMMFFNEIQSDGAGFLGITQSSFQKRLSVAGYYEYLNAMRSIEAILGKAD